VTDTVAQQFNGADTAPPLVSVILPAYNAAAHLRRAVDSALGQTISDLEIVIVDDASTDATLEVAGQIAAQDSRVRVLHNERNAGPSVSRNRAIVGSLGVKINLDAIEFFKKDFYPLLKAGLGGDLEVLVVGSNPSDNVSRLCRDLGWMLYPDVSDEELTRLYRTSTFSILPFRYTTGSKLKLLQSLANGVPCLATLALRDQVESGRGSHVSVFDFE